MISVRNIKKFLDDHPEISNADEILVQAEELAKNGILSGGAIKILFPKHINEFVQAIEHDPEHIEMGVKDIQTALTSSTKITE